MKSSFSSMLVLRSRFPFIEKGLCLGESGQIGSSKSRGLGDGDCEKHESVSIVCVSAFYYNGWQLMNLGGR